MLTPAALGVMVVDDGRAPADVADAIGKCPKRASSEDDGKEGQKLVVVCEGVELRHVLLLNNGSPSR